MAHPERWTFDWFYKRESNMATEGVVTQAIRALAAIDAELGLPEDGCNSTARTLTAIRDLKRKAEQAEELARGDVILSADLLTRIYEAMRARSYVNPARHVSYACPVCAASLEPGLDALRIACDDAMVLYTPAFDHPRTKPVAVIEASGVDDVQVEATSESLDDKVDAMREAIFEMHDKILRKKSI